MAETDDDNGEDEEEEDKQSVDPSPPLPQSQRPAPPAALSSCGALRVRRGRVEEVRRQLEERAAALAQAQAQATAGQSEGRRMLAGAMPRVSRVMIMVALTQMHGMHTLN